MIKTAPPMTAAEKAHRTARWASTMTKWLIRHGHPKGPRWNFVAFNGKSGSEARGVVDLLAIRKNHRQPPRHNGLKAGDLFDIVLIQVKGGHARPPTPSDKARLKLVAAHYDATHVVLGTWRRGKQPQLFKLAGASWQPVQPHEVFG